MGTARAVITGIGVGAVWGVAIRAWMRLISENPEFSMEGTLYIVMVPAIIGALVALAVSARSHDSRWFPAWRVVACISVVLLAVGAGMLTLPTIVYGAVAFAVPAPRLVWRVVLALLLLAGAGTTGSADVGFVTVAFILVTLTLVVLMISGRHARIVFGVAAGLPVVTVMMLIFDSDIAWWRELTGALSYPALMLIPVLALAAVIRPVGVVAPTRVLATT